MAGAERVGCVWQARAGQQSAGAACGERYYVSVGVSACRSAAMAAGRRQAGQLGGACWWHAVVPARLPTGMETASSIMH